MKHNILISIFSVVLMLSFGSVEQVLACSCRESTPCEMYNNTDTVFIGKVIGSKKQITYEETDYSENANTGSTPKVTKTTYDVGEIYFEVSEYFRGEKRDSRVTVFSSESSASCGYLFKRGETYLVYAHKGDKGQLGTGLCSRTAPVSQANEDLEYLRSVSEKAEAQIFGEVFESITFRPNDERKPFGTLTLKIENTENPQLKFQTTTDSEGKYQVKTPAGKYKITPILPEYAKVEDSGSSEKNVSLIAGSCEKVYFHIENKSEINGKLVSSNGKPISKVDVEVIDFETKEWVTDAETDEKGIFKIESVPQGKYILAVNKNLAPHAESPFPTTFYPNKKEIDKAQVIEVSLGKNVENIEFRLLPNFHPKNIIGKVFWSNGKPAVGVRVKLKDLDIDDSWFRDEKNATTDKSGKFIVKGFLGKKYKLEFIYKKNVLIKNAKLEKIGNSKFAPATFYSSEKETNPFILSEKFVIPKTVLKLEKMLGSVQQ